MRIYGRLLRVRSLGVLIASTTLTRVPFAINGLAVLLFLREVSGSFGSAGLVTGALALGAGVGAPLASRLVDRRGAGALVPLAVGHAGALLSLVALGEAGAPLPTLVPAAFAAGVCFPPSGSVLRARFPQLLAEHPELVRGAYALDSVTIEVSFVSGPLITAAALALAGPEAAIFLAAGLVVAGSLLFVSRLPDPLRAPAPAHARTTGLLGALAHPGVRAVALSTLPIGFCLGSVEVALPAFASTEHSPELAGVLLALWSAASGFGGLLFGARSQAHRVVETFLWIALAFPLATLPLALAESPDVMLALVVVAGLPIAPMIATRNELVGQIAPQAAATESFTWLMTSLIFGISAGNAVAGGLVDAHGFAAPVVAGCAVGFAGALLGFTRRRALLATG